MKHIRFDKDLEAAVNRALAAALLQADIDAGFKLMSEHKIPPDILSRVIQGPQFHRKTDWQRCMNP